MKATLTSTEEKQLAAQRELVENFQHIKGLKAGDVLRYSKAGNYRFPEQGGWSLYIQCFLKFREKTTVEKFVKTILLCWLLIRKMAKS